MADAGDATIGGRRMRRRWRVLIALLIGLALAVAVAWVERRPIARGFVDRELARRGVPARYTVAAIGVARQRLTNVVIGDPARPDLVADWIEVATRVGVSGPAVTGIAAGRVRMRARVVDGRLSLGAIDRLMPPPSGKPFALPAIRATLGDVRLRVEAPQGIVGVKLSGAGRLDDGFTGRLALASARLTAGGCAIDGAAAATAVRIADGRPTIAGPVRAANVRCGTTAVQGVAADVRATLGEALDRWRGQARLAAATASAAGIAAGPAHARVTFDGTARATAGTIGLQADRIAAAAGSAGRAAIDGRYRIGAAGTEFAGRARMSHGRIAPRLVAALAVLRQAPDTPLAPLATAVSRALAAAARDLSAQAGIEAVARGGAAAVRVTSLDATSASGARVRVAGDRLRFGNVETGGRIDIAGAGLPRATIALTQTPAGLSGRAIVAPYAAGGATLSLTPVTFAATGGAITRIATVATLSGPLGDGRVDGLRVPIDARWRGAQLAVNAACTAIAWRRLAVAGLALDPARLVLCPTGGALVTLDRGRLGGGARTAAARLTGTLGGSPLTLAATGSTLRLGDRGVALAGVHASIGTAERATRIDAARIDARVAGGAVAGRFAGAGGRIGTVPLVLGHAAGEWRLAGGRLTLTGALTVSDAAPAARFRPLAARGVSLTLADGRIAATGVLTASKDGSTVADVTIDHDLASGAGGAHLAVPGLVFADKGLQPDDLTPITYGVIAGVNGRVAGAGDIAWTKGGVTSSGAFGTERIDLAAAFGPVTGIRGRVRFTDLLGLVSAPDQVATVETINPGILVENGTVRYRLAGDARVQVDGARWPFAGGTLTLAPTLLDFNANQERRMTFVVAGVDAAAFLQQFDFDNLQATGIFDGTLPMVFDERGGRIEHGRLASRAGGGIAYVGTITEKDVGVWGNLAFQALRALDYRALDLTLNGPLAGEMVTEIRFDGVSQGKGTKSNFVIRRLAKLPFVFNITVRAPFRQLADSVRSYYDPSRLIERNLPALLEEKKRREAGLLPSTAIVAPPPVIQPAESEKKP